MGLYSGSLEKREKGMPFSSSDEDEGDDEDMMTAATFIGCSVLGLVVGSSHILFLTFNIALREKYCCPIL